MKPQDTIFALSSGRPPAGVAVIRASGPGVRFGLEMMAGGVPPARSAALRTLRDPASGHAIDRGLVLFFPGPASFTGEDVAEFQLHGGSAVVSAALAMLGALPGFRPAEPGEFTRRAFDNRRLDLTEVEGLADLIAAETEMQRRMALQQADGGLGRLLDGWRSRLIRARAWIEAELDFSDEEDIPRDASQAAGREAQEIAGEIATHLDDAGFGERVREGFDVVLLGAPNVGKSSLLNALARREAAIVTPEPGTTRDLIEVSLDISGYAVTLIDTAGLRESENAIEREGIARARRRGERADLILALDDGINAPVDLPKDVTVVHVRTKSDLGDALRVDSKTKRSGQSISISARTGAGLDSLRREIAEALDLGRPMPSALITRDRQRRGLTETLAALRGMAAVDGPELQAEVLRQAADSLGRIAGKIDVEDWLDVIFREFCIGK